jgi:DNA-binding MarR family transcriptional regulator
MEDAGNTIYKIQNMPNGISITLIAKVDEIWDNDVTWISQKGILSDSTGKTRFRIFKHSNIQGFEQGKTYRIENAVAHIWDSLEWSSIDLDEFSKIVEMPDIDAINKDELRKISLDGLIPAIDPSKGYYYIIAGTATNVVFNEDYEKAYGGNVFVIIKPNGYIGILNTTDCSYHSIKGVNDIQIAKVETGYDLKVSSINDKNLLINFEDVQSVQYRLIPDYPLINNGKIDEIYREKIKEKYPNSSKRWEPEEIFDLLEKHKQNMDIFTLSEVYKRDPSAILSKLCTLNAFQDNVSGTTVVPSSTKMDEIRGKLLDYIISNKSGVRQNTLWKTLGIDSVICSRSLKKLEKEGLIKREMELSDGVKSYRIKYVDLNELIKNSLNERMDEQRSIKESINIGSDIDENLRIDYQTHIAAVLNEYPRSYEKWTNIEVNYLKELISLKTLKEISIILQREPNIILNKIIRKKLLEYSVSDTENVSRETVNIESNDQNLCAECKDYIREIIILANSIKHNGRCIAGKDIKSGEWVRIVPLNENRAFTDAELYELYGDRKGPELLDIISIAFSYKKPLNYHPEDEYIKSESKWEKTGSIANVEDINKLVDTEDWVSNTTNISGKSDRIESAHFDTNKLLISLQLIRLDGYKNRPVIKYQYKQNKNYYRPRLCFDLNGYNYDLVVTYPKYRILNDDPGPESLGNCYIVVGLSEGYEDGYHYKLVVGIIPIK